MARRARHSKELFNAIDRGEKVTLTYHGKPRAVIGPLPTAENKVSEPGESYGMWSDHKDIDKVDEYVRSLRKGREF